MSRLRTTAAGLAAACLVALLTLAPRAAQACFVCMSGRDDETRTAFIATTAFLTFLPLLVAGGAFYWLRRRIRRMEAEQAPQDSAPATVAGLPPRRSAHTRP